MKRPLEKLAIEYDDGTVTAVNSLLIIDNIWFKNNKENIYKLLEQYNLNPAAVHQGKILEFTDIITTAKEIMDILMNNPVESWFIN